jgi:hypothetical protein
MNKLNLFIDVTSKYLAKEERHLKTQLGLVEDDFNRALESSKKDSDRRLALGHFKQLAHRANEVAEALQKTLELQERLSLLKEVEHETQVSLKFSK